MKSSSRGGTSLRVSIAGAAAAVATWWVVVCVSEPSGDRADASPRSGRDKPSRRAAAELVADETRPVERHQIATCAEKTAASRKAERSIRATSPTLALSTPSKREIAIAGETYLDASTETSRLLLFANGETFYEAPLVDGLREGTARAWHRNGRLRAEETFKSGELDGPAVRFDDAGTKTSAGSYSHGLRVGVWSFWRADGSFDDASSGVYVDGERQSR